jgi:alkylhydroperoxidase family enzyme
MAWIEVTDEPEARGELLELYRAMVDPESSRVDNILKIHSLHPKGLRAHFDLYRAVMTSTATLLKVEREIIALVVSGLNGCHY